MNKLIIFGAGEIADLAYYYFRSDSDFSVVGFCVDSAFLTGSNLCGLPLVAFEEVAATFPPVDHHMFVALSYARMNSLRRAKYEAAKNQKYQIARYVSSRACVLNEGRIGENCFILEDNTIQPFVSIGNNVTLWSGNHIGHHSVIGDHCFLASHIVISGGVRIGQGTFVGVNATVRDHVSIGEKCLIGAGALILSDAESEGVYMASETVRSRVPSSRVRNI